MLAFLVFVRPTCHPAGKHGRCHPASRSNSHSKSQTVDLTAAAPTPDNPHELFDLAPELRRFATLERERRKEAEVFVKMEESGLIAPI